MLDGPYRPQLRACSPRRSRGQRRLRAHHPSAEVPVGAAPLGPVQPGPPDPSKLNGFINAFTSDTFVENIDTKSLVTLGRSLQNVDAGAVTFLTVPTDGTNDWGNEIPRTDEIKSLFQAIIDDDPLPGEEREDTTPSSTSSTTTAPTSSTPPAATSVEAMSAYNISVDVSNASGIAGQAATIADSLAAYGFQISTVGNFSAATGLANAQASTTVVRYAAGYEAEAVTVASSIPGAVLVLAPSMGDMIEVVVGSNFAGTVVAPADPGTILAANPTSGRHQHLDGSARRHRQRQRRRHHLRLTRVHSPCVHLVLVTWSFTARRL